MLRYKQSAVLALVILLLIIGSTGVMAAGSALKIVHEPVMEAPSNSPLTIKASVEGDNRIQRVILFMRTAGTNNYYKITAKGKGGNYEAVIPADFMAVGTLEYYLQARDVAGNIATYPGTNAAGEPLQIEVKPDTTVPTASLVAPKGLIGEEAFMVMILLGDEAANVNPDTAEVNLNGEDITDRIFTSARTVRFKVRADEIQTSNKLLVKVQDFAGNEMEETFRLTQKPIISGDFTTAYVADKSGGVLSSELSLEGKWSNFTASADLEIADLSGNSGIDGTFNLSYNGKHLKVGLIDTETTLSDLTVSGYGHRGADVKLNLGPSRTNAAYGYAAQRVAGEQYARRFIGLRQGLDFGFLNMGINFAEIVDDISAGEMSVNPEQNYVFSLDGGIAFKKIKVSTEVAASLYLNNARGDFWSSINSSLDAFDSLGYDVAGVKDILDKVPDAAKELLPLPAADVTTVNQYLKGLGLGGKFEVEVPLPWLEVSGSYYRYGPYFSTLAGNGGKDAQGYNVAIATERFLDSFDLKVDYEKYRDNLPTLSDMIPGTGGDPADFLEYEGEVGYYSDLFDGSVSYGYDSEKDLDTAILKNDKRTISFEVKNIEFMLEDWKGKVKTGYSTSDYSEYDATGTTEGDGKKANKGKVKVTLSKAPWSTSLGYNYKVESDTAANVVQTSVNSPTISLGATWKKRDLVFGDYTLYSLKVGSDLSLTTSKSDDNTVDENKVVLGVEVGAGLTSDSDVTLSYDRSQTTDNLDSNNNSEENVVGLEYSLSF